MRTPLLLLAAALGSSAVAQTPWPLLAARPAALHSQAAINDPRSHGVIGDRFLSLAETILLTNRDIDENALSAEEVAQLSGFGGDIAWADINAAVVPTVTVERELPLIRDTPHGFTISGSNGTPTIDLSDTRGIVVASDFFDATNVRLVGGEHGIQLTQNDTLFGTLLDRVQFDGQDVAGLRMTFPADNRNTRVQISGCRFTGMPTAVVFDDLGAGRTGLLEFFGDTRIDGCEVGVDVRLGTGGSLTVYANGLVATGCGDALRIRSLAAPRRDLLFEGRYLRLAGSRTGLTIQGDPSAQSRLLLQALDVVSPGTALEIAALGSHVDLRLQDSRIAGPTRLFGAAAGRITVDNVVLSDGNLEVGTTGAPATIEGAILDRKVTTTWGSATLRIVGSLLLGGSVTGTATAPASVEDGFDAGTTFGAHVTLLRPLPAAHLGTFDATPLEPVLGGVLLLSAALPAGLDGYVVFGRTLEYPTTLPAGLRLYADGAALVMVPTALSGQASLPIPIPNLPALEGLDLFFHLAVTPQPGGPGASLALPPGRRIRIR